MATFIDYITQEQYVNTWFCHLYDKITLAQLQSGARPMKTKKMASVYIYQTYLQTKYKLINPKLD